MKYTEADPKHIWFHLCIKACRTNYTCYSVVVFIVVCWFNSWMVQEYLHEVLYEKCFLDNILGVVLTLVLSS